MFDGRWRTGVDRATQPVGSALRRTGVTADHLTALGLVMGAFAAIAIGSGRTGLGLGLLAASALPDLLDGPVAKASGTAGPRGAFFDSVADRVTDALVLGGVAWYLAGRDGGRAALLPYGVLAASSLVSYQRAKAESLGYQARGGLMERAERLMVLGLGLAVSSILVPVLWVLLVLTVATAVQRFARVWRQAPAPVIQRTRLRPRGDRVPIEARWRAWREGSVPRAERRAPGWGTRSRRPERPGRRRSRTRP